MAMRGGDGQRSLAEALIEPQLGSNRRLEKIAALLDWAAIGGLLCELRSGTQGAPPYPALLMFKALLLQQWYGLSDPALEEALGDRLSFRRFVGLALADASPDHTTLWRFRQDLAASGQLAKAFEEVLRQLDGRGLVIKQGTLIDASLVAAGSVPPPPPPAEAIAKGASPLTRCPHEPDADWTRRGGSLLFGYKLHIAADQGSLLVRKAMLTAASCNETMVADQLICGDEAAVYADKAYDTQARRAALRARGVKDRIQHRANKHHRTLPRWQQRRNKLIGRIRGRIETINAVLKRYYRFDRARYCTLLRNQAALLLACVAFNLRRALVLPP